MKKNENPTPVIPTPAQTPTLTRLGLRRAGLVEGNVLTVWRLRKPSKAGKQKTRDITKRLTFKTSEEAQAALQIKVLEWEARQSKANHEDPEESDPMVYTKAENAADLANLTDDQLEKLIA